MFGQWFKYNPGHILTVLMVTGNRISFFSLLNERKRQVYFQNYVCMSKVKILFNINTIQSNFHWMSDNDSVSKGLLTSMFLKLHIY